MRKLNGYKKKKHKTIKTIQIMKTLSKTKPFYQTCLNHFRKQYKDVVELTSLKITADNKVCGGEWVNSKGDHCVANSVDCVRVAKIVD